MIKFDATETDNAMIQQIAKRASALAGSNDIDYDFVDACMDLTAVHLNDSALNLEKLAESPDPDFGHDVFGIRRFIDRTSGKLTQGFWPSCGGRPEVSHA